jgi:rfaE bifunctional protein kinase chain/domain
MNPRILVIGDAMLDRYWSGSVDRVSPEAAVPVLRLEHHEARPGGAANVAANLARLGCSVTLAALTGTDEAGSELAGLLTSAGVQLDGLRAQGVKTTVKVRYVARHQHLLRTDIEAEPHREQVDVFTRMLVLPQLRDGWPWVVLSDYAKGALGLCPEIIAAATARGSRVLVDPKGRDWERYRGAWLLKPNTAEFEVVAGSWSTEAEFVSKAFATCRRFDLQHLLITRGEFGMALFSADGTGTAAHATAHDVFDVTGAGDTTMAALVASLAAGQALHDAVHSANRAAGIVVGRFGTATVAASELTV